jgi:hypothetical protein
VLAAHYITKHGVVIMLIRSELIGTSDRYYHPLQFLVSCITPRPLTVLPDLRIAHLDFESARDDARHHDDLFHDRFHDTLHVLRTSSFISRWPLSSRARHPTRYRT